MNIYCFAAFATRFVYANQIYYVSSITQNEGHKLYSLNKYASISNNHSLKLQPYLLERPSTKSTMGPDLLKSYSYIRFHRAKNNLKQRRAKHRLKLHKYYFKSHLCLFCCWSKDVQMLQYNDLSCYYRREPVNKIIPDMSCGNLSCKEKQIP